MSTYTPDDYETVRWNASVDSRDALTDLLARITNGTRIKSVTWKMGDGGKLTRTEVQAFDQKVTVCGFPNPLRMACEIIAVVPVAEPAWTSCRAVMDREGDVWVRVDEDDEGNAAVRWRYSDGDLWTTEYIAVHYGPIRPLVDADGRVVSGKDIKKGEW